MNIDELQSVRDRERQTDRPQQLRESFYEDVGAFVEQLRTERDRAAERHDSPYADEVRQLTDEIDAARQLVEDIHERRIGKVVKAASLEAAELSPEVDGLTTEERDLFGTLVADIEDHRGDVLAAVEGEEEKPPESASTASGGTTASDDGGVAAADVMGERSGGESASVSEHDDGDSEDRDTRSEHPDPGQLHPGAGPDETTNGDSASRTPSPDETTDGDSASRTPSPDETTDGDSASRTPSQGDSATRQSGGEQPAATDGTGDSTADSREPHGDDGRTGGRAGTDGPSHSADTGESREPTLGSSVERDRVLVTEDVATFVGSDDRDYDLVADDVVTLPATNADILVDRDAAKRL